MTHKMGDHSHTIDDSTQILQNTDQSWKCYKNNNINIIKYNYVYCLYIYCSWICILGLTILPKKRLLVSL